MIDFSTDESFEAVFTFCEAKLKPRLKQEEKHHRDTVDSVAVIAWAAQSAV